MARKATSDVERHFRRYHTAKVGDESMPADVSADVIDDSMIYLHRRRYERRMVTLPLKPMIVRSLTLLCHD